MFICELAAMVSGEIVWILCTQQRCANFPRGEFQNVKNIVILLLLFLVLLDLVFEDLR